MSSLPATTVADPLSSDPSIEVKALATSEHIQLNDFFSAKGPPEDPTPAKSEKFFPKYAWKRRSIKRSSYDLNNILSGISSKDTAAAKSDAGKHPKITIPDVSHMPSLPAFAAKEAGLDGYVVSPLAKGLQQCSVKTASSNGRKTPKPHDIHAELHWEIFGGNPRNWTRKARWMHTIIACLFAFVCTLASTTLTPFSETSSERDDHGLQQLLPTSLCVLGLAFGPLLSGLASEAFGRKVVYVIGLACFVIFTAATSLLRSPTGIMACRFLTGFSSAPLLHAGFGIISDIWKGPAQSSALAMYIFAVVLGSSIGPVVAAFTLEYAAPKWSQYVVLLLTGLCVLPVLLMRETAKKVINRRKDGTSTLAHVSAHDCYTLCVVPLRMLLTEPTLLACTACAAYSVGVLYDIYLGYPKVLRDSYHFTVGGQGLCFVSISVGAFVAVIALLVYQDWFYKPQAERFKLDASSERESVHNADYEAWRSQFGRAYEAHLAALPSEKHGSVFDLLPRSPIDSGYSIASTRIASSVRSLLKRAADKPTRQQPSHGRQKSLLTRLTGLSTGRLGDQPENNQTRNLIMARAAATYLNSIASNADKQISTQRMLFALDQNLQFQHFGSVLEAMNIQFDRFALARVLAEALAFYASPSTNRNVYAWGNNGSFNAWEKSPAVNIESSLDDTCTVEDGSSPIAVEEGGGQRTWLNSTSVAPLPPPEWRLWLAMPAAVGVATSLFMLGWTTNPKIHCFVPLLAMGLFAASHLVLLVSLLQYLVEKFDDERAVVAAYHTLLFLFAFLVSLSAGSALELGARVGMSVYAGIGVGLAMVPFFYYVYGMRVRRRAGTGSRGSACFGGSV